MLIHHKSQCCGGHDLIKTVDKQGMRTDLILFLIKTYNLSQHMSQIRIGCVFWSVDGIKIRNKNYLQLPIIGSIKTLLK